MRRRTRSRRISSCSYAPRVAMRREIADALRVVFNAPDRIEAERRPALSVKHYRDSAPKLAEWMGHNVSCVRSIK